MFFISKNLKPLQKSFLSLLFLLFSFPLFSFAAGLVPNCGANCGYNDLLNLIKTVIDWIIRVSIPISAGVMAWAGFVLMTSSVTNKRADAIKIMQKVFYGFIFILASWLIVSTIVNTFLANPDIVPIDTRQ